MHIKRQEKFELYLDRLLKSSGDSDYPLFECVPKMLRPQFKEYLDTIIHIYLKDKLNEFDKPRVLKETRKEPLDQVWERQPKYLIEYQLVYLLINEILFDLYCEYKNNDLHFKSRQQIIDKILLIFEKYSSFINVRIRIFRNNLSQLVRGMRKEKIKIDKIKRIPLVFEPVEITLDIRYAVIKRSNGKCEECGSSILERPIDVYQIKTDDEEGATSFIAYCNMCKDRNNERIISVKNE